MTRYFFSFGVQILTRGLTIGLVGMVLILGNPAYAQDTLRIVAVVNDDIISALDLQSRTMMVTILSKLPQNQQTVNRLAPQVLRLLIDEKLKLQEAARMGFEIRQPEIEEALQNAEKIHKFPPGKLVELLERSGIGVDTLIEQIKSDISWARIVPRKYGDNIEITDEDVSTALAAEQQRQNQPQFLLSEIALAVDSPSNAPVIREQAQQLIGELQNGARFESLARAFSQAASAKNGGALGWMRLDQLPESLSSVVRTMRSGQISNPISVPGALMIMYLRDMRQGPAEKKADTLVDVHQFHLSLPGDAADSVVQSYVNTAAERTQNSKSCADLSNAAQAFGSPLSGGLGKISMSKLPKDMSAIVGALEVNTPSNPIRTTDAVVVLMVCERISPREDQEADKRLRVRQRIFGERIAVYARQAIRDLRRSAFINIR